MTLFSLWLNVLNCFELLKNLLLPSKNKSAGVVVAQKHKCFNKSVSSWSQLRLHNIWWQKATKFYEVSLYLCLYVQASSTYCYYVILQGSNMVGSQVVFGEDTWYLSNQRWWNALPRNHIFNPILLSCFLMYALNIILEALRVERHEHTHIHTPTNIHTPNVLNKFYVALDEAIRLYQGSSL